MNHKANPAQGSQALAGFRSRPCVVADRDGFDSTDRAAVEWVRRRLRISDAHAKVIVSLAGLGPREDRR